MVVQAQQNDTFDAICWRYFGTTSGITEQVLTLNPHLSGNSPVLAIGTDIRLPDHYTAVKSTINLWD